MTEPGCEAANRVGAEADRAGNGALFAERALEFGVDEVRGHFEPDLSRLRAHKRVEVLDVTRQLQGLVVVGEAAAETQRNANVRRCRQRHGQRQIDILDRLARVGSRIVIGDLAAFDLQPPDADPRNTAVGLTGLRLVAAPELPVRRAALVHLEMDDRVLEKDFRDFESTGQQRHQLGADDDRFDFHHLRMAGTLRIGDRNVGQREADLRIDREPHGTANMHFAPECRAGGALDRCTISIEGKKKRYGQEERQGSDYARDDDVASIHQQLSPGARWGQRARRDDRFSPANAAKGGGLSAAISPSIKVNSV